MDTLEYKGKLYMRNNQKWFDSSYIVVHERLQRELNEEFSRKIDLSSLSLEDCIAYGDKFKHSNSNSLALRFYEEAAGRADQRSMSYILPRMTSCYRKLGQPQKAINILTYASKTFGSVMVTPALLTSAAAAYCDLEDYTRAKQCCDRAYAAGRGTHSEELSLVYKRIKKATE